MAKSVFEKDEILDELNREAIDTLTGYATEHTASIRLCLPKSRPGYSANLNAPATISTTWPKRPSSTSTPKC